MKLSYLTLSEFTAFSDTETAVLDKLEHSSG